MKVVILPWPADKPWKLVPGSPELEDAFARMEIVDTTDEMEQLFYEGVVFEQADIDIAIEGVEDVWLKRE